MPRLAPVRPVLAVNAVFSMACGGALLVTAEGASALFGLDAVWVYLVLGGGLVLFGLGVAVLAARPTPLPVLLVSIADLSWVVGTMAVLVMLDGAASSLGWALVLGANAVVTACAGFQLRALHRAFAVPGHPGEYAVCVAVPSPVPVERLWPVVADLGAIQRYLPSLRHSVLDSKGGAEVGAVRRCENHRGEAWAERCDQWEAGRSFSLTFLAEAPGFPFPFARMRGGWRLEPGLNGCTVEVWWRMVPRRPWAAVILLPIMATSARRTMIGVVGRMSGAAAGSSLNGTPATLPAARAVFC